MNSQYQEHRADLADIIIKKSLVIPQKRNEKNYPIIFGFFTNNSLTRISLALLILSFFIGFNGGDLEIENQETVFEKIYSNNTEIL